MSGSRRLKKLLLCVWGGAALVVMICFSNHESTGTNSVFDSQNMLLAELAQTKDSISYGTGTDKQVKTPGRSETEDYIQYHAGSGSDENDYLRWQEQNKEAASMNMLQNLFIGVDDRPRRVLPADRPVR
jgi:hypothetical protein